MKNGSGSALSSQYEPGTLIDSSIISKFQDSDSLLPLRISRLNIDSLNQVLDKPLTTIPRHDLSSQASTDELSDLDSLGILVPEDLDDSDNYPVVTGRGVIGEAISICHMVALTQRSF